MLKIEESICNRKLQASLIKFQICCLEGVVASLSGPVTAYKYGSLAASVAGRYMFYT